MKRLVSLGASLFAILLIVGSCAKNDEADIISYNIPEQEADIEINGSDHTISVAFPEGFIAGDDLVAEFILSDGAIATVDGEEQTSGVTANNFQRPFSYLVESEDGKNIITWTLLTYNNSYTSLWGLGGFQVRQKGNNRDYEWYIDQAHTGTWSGVNCGPSSTTMAAKWSASTFTKSAEDARAAYRPSGGWWYTNDINNYLTDNAIPHYVINLSSSAEGTKQTLVSELDNGHIQILCVDMYYVRNETNISCRVDKFYSASTTGWGHFIVVKGYRRVDGNVFFEVYDPYCYDKTYNDGTLKGKDRYYRSDDIFSATFNWWNYAIVVAGTVPGKSVLKGLDPETVPIQWGR